MKHVMCKGPAATRSTLLSPLERLYDLIRPSCDDTYQNTPTLLTCSPPLVQMHLVLPNVKPRVHTVQTISSRQRSDKTMVISSFKENATYGHRVSEGDAYSV